MVAMTRRYQLGAKQVCLECLNTGKDYAGKPCRALGCKVKLKKRPRALPEPDYATAEIAIAAKLRDHPLVREVLGTDVCRAFDLFDICTEETERAGVLGSMSSEMFKLLAPNEEFKHTAPEVYRSHVRELIERYKAAQPLDAGTDAEVLLGLMHASQVAPLNRGGAALYHRMFRRVMGEESYRGIFDDLEPPRERWPGECDELETDARRKVRSRRPRKVS
jgi:hypothetical protein